MGKGKGKGKGLGLGMGKGGDMTAFHGFGSIILSTRQRPCDGESPNAGAALLREFNLEDRRWPRIWRPRSPVSHQSLHRNCRKMTRAKTLNQIGVVRVRVGEVDGVSCYPVEGTPPNDPIFH